MKAARGDNHEVVKLLVSHPGIDVDMTNHNRETALDIARALPYGRMESIMEKGIRALTERQAGSSHS